MAVLSSSTTHFFPRTISVNDVLSLCNTNSRGQQSSKVQLFCLSIVMKISAALQALDRSLRYFQVGSYKCLPHNNLPFPQGKKKKKKWKIEPEGEVHNSKETQAWFYMKGVGWKKKRNESYALWSVTGFNHRIFPKTAFWLEILTGIFKPIQYCCSDSEVAHTKLNWF